MQNKFEEWFRQSDYDMETAKYMYRGRRYFYAVFMCHLSIEKALKGLYIGRTDELPPKTHNLIYLINKIGIKPPDEIGKFLVTINEASVATRYPEDLEILSKNFTKKIVSSILKESQKAIKWIKLQL